MKIVEFCRTEGHGGVGLYWARGGELTIMLFRWGLVVRMP